CAHDSRIAEVGQSRPTIVAIALLIELCQFPGVRLASKRADSSLSSRGRSEPKMPLRLLLLAFAPSGRRPARAAAECACRARRISPGTGSMTYPRADFSGFG